MNLPNGLFNAQINIFKNVIFIDVDAIVPITQFLSQLMAQAGGRQTGPEYFMANLYLDIYPVGVSESQPVGSLRKIEWVDVFDRSGFIQQILLDTSR